MVLPAFEFSELVNQGEFGRVQLYRLSLCRPRALYYRAAARFGERVWDSRQVSKWERRVSVDRRAGHLEQRCLSESAERAGLSGRRTSNEYAGAHRVLRGPESGSLAGAPR